MDWLPFTKYIYINICNEGNLLSIDLEKVYITNKSKDITLKINPHLKRMKDILSEADVVIYFKNHRNFEIWIGYIFEKNG